MFENPLRNAVKHGAESNDEQVVGTAEGEGQGINLTSGNAVVTDVPEPPSVEVEIGTLADRCGL